MHAQAVAIDPIPGPSRSRWSLDAQVMVRPARTYRRSSATRQRGGVLAALRRPILITVSLGCLASLATAGIATLRLSGPAVAYWAYAPLTQLLAVSLVLVVTRRGTQQFGAALDAYFAGCAPVTLVVLLLGSARRSARPDPTWRGRCSRPLVPAPSSPFWRGRPVSTTATSATS